MAAGLYFEPFKNADSITVAITGGLGLIALAIRNTSSKTLIKNISPSTMMTGNTTQLGIDIANLLKIIMLPIGQVCLKCQYCHWLCHWCFDGAVLYVYFDFWA